MQDEKSTLSGFLFTFVAEQKQMTADRSHRIRTHIVSRAVFQPTTFTLQLSSTDKDTPLLIFINFLQAPLLLLFCCFKSSYTTAGNELPFATLERSRSPSFLRQHFSTQGQLKKLHFRNQNQDKCLYVYSFNVGLNYHRTGACTSHALL